jgi:type I restriction enzyme S subunit
MTKNYQPLKDHIRLADARNKGLQTTNLLGINIDKFFMPSVANIIGTDLSDYKLIKHNQFACNPMHVGRDERIPIALFQGDDAAIVSPAYFVFEIADADKLLPKYAMLWFMRPEFDRECWFYTDSSVRGGITWDAIADMRLPVPSLDKQRAIIEAYEIIQRRIELKRKINDNLAVA